VNPTGAFEMFRNLLRRRSWCHLLPALAALACEEPVRPYLLAFERVGDSSYSQSPQVFVNTITRQVMVQGSFRTPCEPYTATAQVERRLDSLRILITGRRGLECPQDIVGTFGFRVTLGNLPPGKYHIRTVHTYVDVAWAPDSLDYPAVDLP